MLTSSNGSANMTHFVASLDDLHDFGTTLCYYEYSSINGWEPNAGDAPAPTVTKMSSDDTQTTGYTTFTVGGVSSFSGVNATYTKVSGEGRTAVYSAPDASGYGSSWKVRVRAYNEVDRWVIEDGDSKSVVVVYATANLDAEHPWEVTEWYDDNNFSAPTVTFTNLA